MTDEPLQESRSHPSLPATVHPLHLRLHPDPILRDVCHPIERFDSWLSDLLADMLALMRAYEGIGLAAPQVGIAQRLFVAEIHGRSVCLINPAIAARDGSDRMIEGCLSLPDVQVDVERDRQVEVQGYDAYGRRRRHRVQGLWAHVVQHEIDHLDGVLICDKTHRGYSMR
jgi:peptide deformylase